MGKLRCKYCGEPIDIKTGICSACGQYTDSITHTRIVNVSELARQYGYTEEPGDEYMPEIFDTEPVASDELPPELLLGGSRRPVSGASDAEPVRERRGIGRYSGYLSRLDVTAGARVVRENSAPESEQAYTVERTVGQKVQALLSKDRPDIREEQPETEEKVESAAAQETAQPEIEQLSEPEQVSEPEEQVSFKERLPEKLRGPYEKIWENKLRPIYMKVDEFLSPVTQKIVEWFRAKFPMPSRSKGNPVLERMAVIGAGFAAIALLIVLIIGIASLFPANLRGEWMVSEELSVEFSLDGTVTSWVYVDGDARVERRGTYTVRRKNGHDLLTIVYEDGVERRLYYSIEGDVGTFTNVDTNMQAQYTRA